MSWRSRKRTPRYDSKKTGGLSDVDPYRYVRTLSETEVKPIIESLSKDSISETIKQSLRKYLIVLLISTLEYFFKNEVRRIVDKNDLDTSELFEGKISLTVTDLDQLLKDKTLTKGSIVASSFNFMNLDEIDGVFSNLLQMKFLHYVRMFNDINQTSQVFDGHPIPLEYRRMREAYELRHEIIHELKDVHLTKTKVKELWDNALNIMEIANSVFASVGDPSQRASLDQDYERGIEREKRKKLYVLYSEKIMLRLLEGEIQLTNRYNLAIADLGLGDPTENIDRTIRTMLKKNLVEFDMNILRLTPKGRTRAKKIKKNNDK